MSTWLGYKKKIFSQNATWGDDKNAWGAVGSKKCEPCIHEKTKIGAVFLKSFANQN